MTKKLMIVDEHAIARQLMRQVAALPEDTVWECDSPEEALQAVGIFQPDCVMISVSRPRSGVFETIKNIRESHPAMRVVVVSRFAETGLRQMVHEAGASGYVNTDNLSELFVLAAPEQLAWKPSRRKQK